MAEALAVVGIVANIAQLVDFGSKVLHRLDEYQSKLGDVPESFRHIKLELPVLLDTLQGTKTAITTGLISHESEKPLLPAINGCHEQIASLDNIISKILPASSDSWAKRRQKAIRSLRYDARVEKLVKIIRGYVQTLTFHAASSSKWQPLAGMYLN
jgi:hypothetical protein